MPPERRWRKPSRRCAGGEWLGANVTVPYKEIVLPLLDEITEAARAVGAVNTIINRGGRLIRGEQRHSRLRGGGASEAGIDVAGGAVVLLGAGGSARAVAAAVREMGAARLIVANRTPARAAAVAALWGSGGDMRTRFRSTAQNYARCTPQMRPSW